MKEVLIYIFIFILNTFGGVTHQTISCSCAPYRCFETHTFIEKDGEGQWNIEWRKRKPSLHIMGGVISDIYYLVTSIYNTRTRTGVPYSITNIMIRNLIQNALQVRVSFFTYIYNMRATIHIGSITEIITRIFKIK